VEAQIHAEELDMKRLYLIALFAFLASFNDFSPSVAHADTYQSVTIHAGDYNSNDYFLYGIDNKGDFVTDRPNCDELGDTCYYSFVSGDRSSSSFTPPALDYDNSTVCGTSDFAVEICNEGKVAFIAKGPAPSIDTLYSGPSSELSIVKSGDFGFINPLMDSNGDIVFDDGNNFEEYIDVTSRLGVTPEPTSIALLGTGILGFAGFIRRGLSKHS
jgi:PEP-CTERM motif